jgi:hypothetical protein
MGDPTVGPLVVLTDAPAGSVAFPASRFSTEVLRVAICGGTIAGNSRTVVGDAQIKPAMAAWERAVADAGGAGEFIVFGDRRKVLEHDASSEWEAAIQAMAIELAAELSSRTDLAPTG